MEELIIGMLQHYRKACRKHPKFCMVLTTMPKERVAEQLKSVREINDSGRGESAISVLKEEVLEALEAYYELDRSKIRDEVLDAIAVLMRIYMSVSK